MATSRMVEQACWEPTSGPAGSWAAQAGSLLAMSGQGVDAAEEGRSSRSVIRLAFGRHDCVRLNPPPCALHMPEECDCPPPVCEDPRHTEAAAGALVALQVLGLAEGDPASRRKKCVSCKATKLLAEFTSDPRAAAGVHATCKKCRIKKDAERKAKRAAS
jgi:hypothetical protein